MTSFCDVVIFVSFGYTGGKGVELPEVVAFRPALHDNRLYHLDLQVGYGGSHLLGHLPGPAVCAYDRGELELRPQGIYKEGRGYDGRVRPGKDRGRGQYQRG